MSQPSKNNKNKNNKNNKKNRSLHNGVQTSIYSSKEEAPEGNQALLKEALPPGKTPGGSAPRLGKANQAQKEIKSR